LEEKELASRDVLVPQMSEPGYPYPRLMGTYFKLGIANFKLQNEQTANLSCLAMMLRMGYVCNLNIVGSLVKKEVFAFIFAIGAFSSIVYKRFYSPGTILFAGDEDVPARWQY